MKIESHLCVCCCLRIMKLLFYDSYAIVIKNSSTSRLLNWKTVMVPSPLSICISAGGIWPLVEGRGHYMFFSDIRPEPNILLLQNLWSSVFSWKNVTHTQTSYLSPKFLINPISKAIVLNLLLLILPTLHTKEITYQNNKKKAMSVPLFRLACAFSKLIPLGSQLCFS